MANEGLAIGIESSPENVDKDLDNALGILEDKKKEIFADEDVERAKNAVAKIRSNILPKANQSTTPGEYTKKINEYIDFFENIEFHISERIIKIITSRKKLVFNDSNRKARAEKALKTMDHLSSKIVNEHQKEFESLTIYFESLVKLSTPHVHTFNTISEAETALKTESTDTFFPSVEIEGKKHYRLVEINFPDHIDSDVPAYIVNMIAEKIKQTGSKKAEMATVKIITRDKTKDIDPKVLRKQKKDNLEAAKAETQRSMPEVFDAIQIFENRGIMAYPSSQAAFNNFIKPLYGKDFQSKSGALCAQYVAAVLNKHFPNIGAAGHAGTIIPRMIAAGTLTTIDGVQANNWTINDAIAERYPQYEGRYKTNLTERFNAIKSALNKNGLPAIVGAHFLYTETTGETDDLRDWHKELQKDSQGTLSATPNSHVFLAFPAYTLPLPKSSLPLKNQFEKYWRKDKNISKGSIDWNSPLLSDIQVFENGEHKGNILDLKNESFSGSIVLKGIGADDEIEGLRRNFLAIRLATKSAGKPLYTLAAAAQVSNTKFEEDNKKLHENLGISVGEEESLPKGFEYQPLFSLLRPQLRNKYYNLYRRYRNLIKKSPSEKQKDRYREAYRKQLAKLEEKNAGSGNLQGAGNIAETWNYHFERQLGVSSSSKDKRTRQEYFLLTQYYLKFFGLSDTNLSITRSYPNWGTGEKAKEKALAAATKWKDQMRESGYEDLILAEEEKNSQTKEVQLKENGIQNTDDLMKYFLKEANLPEELYAKEYVKTTFLSFFIKIGGLSKDLYEGNRGSYFSQVILEYAKSGGKEARYFEFESSIFYKPAMLNELKQELDKNRLTAKKEELASLQKNMSDVPLEYMRKTFDFPLTAEQLYEICDGDPYTMRVLMGVAYNERYRGKWDAEKSEGFSQWLKQKGSEYIDWEDDAKVRVGTLVDKYASAGILQISTRVYSDKQLSNKISVLLEKINDLSSKNLISIDPSLEQYLAIINGETTSITEKRNALQRLLLDSPEINFIMGAMRVKEERNNVVTQVQSIALPEEKIDDETLMTAHMDGWSGDKLRRLNLTVNILEEFIHTLNLEKHSFIIKLRTEEKRGKEKVVIKQGKKYPVISDGIKIFEEYSDVEKDQIRIEAFTLTLLAELTGTSSINPYITDLREHFRMHLDTDNLQSFVSNVSNELLNNRNVMESLMGSTENTFDFDITPKAYPHFYDFFMILRKYNPNITVRYDEKIGDTRRMKGGNYGYRQGKAFSEMNEKEGFTPGVPNLAAQKLQEIEKKQSEMRKRELEQAVKDRSQALSIIKGGKKWLSVTVNKNEEFTTLTGMKKKTLVGIGNFLQMVKDSETDTAKYFEYKDGNTEIRITGAGEYKKGKDEQTTGKDAFGHEIDNEWTHKEKIKLDISTKGNNLQKFIREHGKFVGYRTVTYGEKPKKSPMYEITDPQGGTHFIIDEGGHLDYMHLTGKDSYEYRKQLVEWESEKTIDNKGKETDLNRTYLDESYSLNVQGVMQTPENNQHLKHQKIMQQEGIENRKQHSYEMNIKNENLSEKGIYTSIAKLMNHGAKAGDTVIVVRPTDQTTYIVKIGGADGSPHKILHKYLVSTAKNGIGNEYGSYKTPHGVHRIKSKIGKNSPLGTKFKSRKSIGQSPIYTDGTSSEDDSVMSRILWLEGIDNEAKNIQKNERYVYFHGTDEEGKLGTPQSNGCIRMGNQDAIDLFEMVSDGENGTLIDIQNN